MTAAEYADMFWAAQEMGVNALMLYLTVISGYLVVAYLVGGDLSRAQSGFISGLFVVFATYSLWGVVQYWWTGDQIRLILEAGPLANRVDLNWVAINPALIAGPMGLIGIGGALRFMWDVRRHDNRS
ncbi:MAG: hypothetical protein DWP92_03890 [Armatimonadetes bacterium]|nr:MAG: hypothetical protein DWP92_03890 [Armatimonadota bacterium]